MRSGSLRRMILVVVAALLVALAVRFAAGGGLRHLGEVIHGRPGGQAP
jgi:hypothetical protein